MVIVLQVTPTAQGWEMQILDPETESPLLDPQTGAPLLAFPRLLGRHGAGKEAFPLPPAGEALPPGWTAAELPNTYLNLMNRAAGPSGVALFGNYLFQTLLGAPLWGMLNTLAGENPLEFGLRFAPADYALARLPWEAMYSLPVVAGAPQASPWEGFLAGQPDVAINRCIQGGAASALELPQPPRVLFVVSADLTDATIRPGAEFLGLIRNLRTRGLSLNTHLLLDATVESLETAMVAFRPHIVHFIGHGIPLDSGEVGLEFKHPDPGNGTVGVGAQRLLQHLRTEKNLPLPPIVVLNACSTTRLDESTPWLAEVVVGRPMATGLVEGGVSIVVGMGGQVADQACRLFTKSFYQALLQEEPIALAVARGRRAAIAYGDYDPENTLDWALPTLILASGMESARVNLNKTTSESGRSAAAFEFLAKEDYPVFLGRWHYFKAYHQLMNQEDYQYLAITVSLADNAGPNNTTPHFGRTRLLKELAAQAMRDGHIPILVTKDLVTEAPRSGDEPSWPQDFHDFVKILFRASYQTRNLLKENLPVHQDLQWSWNYFYQLLKLPDGDALPDHFPEAFRADLGLSPHDIEMKALAFRLDLLELLHAVCAQRATEQTASPKLVLLLDDLHQMVAFTHEILTLIGDTYGLRGAREQVRVIFTYSTEALDEQADTVKQIDRWGNRHSVLTVPLEMLHHEVQATALGPQWREGEYDKIALLYRHFLLHWRDQQQVSPLTLAYSDERKESQWIIGEIATRVNGYPAKLSGENVDEIIRTLRRMPGGYLRPADDDAALAHLAQLNQRGRI